ncbi:response regulator [Exilibacterium tricleocarpae]|uniref:Response regulator n=2 Tax=Exilibacterium tricleocarpae TaxID=2591008 RepID=A0A545TZK2_9GAMM|nr:response regulator [Exilibacterium tricleocarpae]
MPMKNIFLLEDNQKTRTWVASVLKRLDANARIHMAENIADARTILKRVGGDIAIAIIDINLPDGNGLSLIKDIKSENLGTQCVVFTVEECIERISQAFLLGADGFLLKDTEEDVIVERLRGVEVGIPAISPAVIRKLIKLVRSQIGSRHPELLDSLTDREKEILLLVSKGYNKREIGQLLNISENTIKDHTKRLYTKLGINNVAEATLVAMNAGLLQCDA